MFPPFPQFAPSPHTITKENAAKIASLVKFRDRHAIRCLFAAQDYGCQEQAQLMSQMLHGVSDKLKELGVTIPGEASINSKSELFIGRQKIEY